MSSWIGRAAKSALQSEPTLARNANATVAVDDGDGGLVVNIGVVRLSFKK